MRYVIINAFFSEETAMPKKGRAVGAGRGWGFGWHVPRPTRSPPIFKADQLTLPQAGRGDRLCPPHSRYF